jgi:hypothetical protein
MERLITDGLETIHIQRLYTEACCAAAIHSAETGLGRHPPAMQLSCDYPSENRKNMGFLDDQGRNDPKVIPQPGADQGAVAESRCGTRT